MRTSVRYSEEVNEQRAGDAEDSPPYGTARDLPSFREMSQLVKGATFLTRFFARRLRPQLLDAERELNRLAALVDRFYERLGPRNWIFHDALPVDEIEQLLAEAPDPDIAEMRLIELYRRDEFFTWRLQRLYTHEGLSTRRQQIERALEHYGTSEFDSCVFHLIAVMDGFVNDFEAENRKGLHAREPIEMAAWDSIVGHHRGLSHAMETFRVTVKKRVDTEVFDLYRNGIMHGMVVNFDNEVVATKAWNMLFAVADWATATTKAAEPQEPTPTWREALASIRRNAEARRRDEQHVEQTIEYSDARFAADEAVLQAKCFLEAWERGQWGIVTEFMPPVLRERRTNGQAISETKSWFGTHEITAWSITSVTHVLPGTADICGVATVNDEQCDMKFRMVHLDPEGDRAPREIADARWHVGIWAPQRYFEPVTDETA